jgi:flagellum-specific peptidoglycan hydrolase FlgJ
VPGEKDTQSHIPNSDSPAPSAQHPVPQSGDYGHFDFATWEIENGQKQLVIAQFQRFPNLHEAFAAHARLLQGPRYQPAFAVRHDWKQFAERLGPKTSQLDAEHCGYSTNPSYSAELIKLVELYRLNEPRALQWFATGIDPKRGAGPLTEEL